MSIRWRTTCWLLGGLALTMAGAGYRLFSQAQTSLTAAFDRALLAQVVTLSTYLEEDEEGLELEIDPRAVPEFFRAENPQYFEVGLSADALVARSPTLGEARLAWPPGEILETTAWNLELPDGRAGRAVAVRLQAGPVEEDGEEAADSAGFGPAPEPIIVIARDREPLARALADLTETALITGIIALLAVVLVVAIALRRGLAPLTRLANEVGAMDVATLSVPLSIEDQPQELLPLSAKLNEFLARLESSFRRERRMTANMAHELRAPIAEIRSAAEVATRWPEDESLQADALEVAREVSAEMSRVVDALLQLSRAQIGGAAATLLDVDLQTLVSQGIERFSDRVEEKRLAVSEVPADFMATARLRSDAVMVEIIIRNLLDNAISHSPEQGQVKSACARRGALLTWTLSNGPVALDAADLEHIWEPLWRKEEARSDRVHVGLGLALVKALVDYLGLAVATRLENQIFTIELSGAGRSLTVPGPSENQPEPQAQNAAESL